MKRFAIPGIMILTCLSIVGCDSGNSVSEDIILTLNEFSSTMESTNDPGTAQAAGDKVIRELTSEMKRARSVGDDAS